MKIFLKSLLWGFAIYLVTITVSTLITVAGTLDEPKDNIVYALMLKHALFLWLSLAFGLLYANKAHFKRTWGGFVARMIFIWAPISLGWYLFINFRHESFFLIGMFLSSIALAYEFIVHRGREL